MSETKTVERSYLPGLQSVTLDNGAGLAKAVAILASILPAGLLLVFIAAAWVGTPLRPAATWLWVFICLGIVSVLSPTLVIRLDKRTSWFDSYWKTSVEGLEIHGLVYRRFVPWSDVTEVRTWWVDMVVGRRYELRTDKITVHVPTDNIRLDASIWQHLSRFGKADGIELPPVAQELWSHIPDSLPRTLAWRNPYAPHVLLCTILYLAGVLALGLACWYLLPYLLGFAAVIPALAAIGLVRGLWMTASTARRFVVREDGFVAEDAFGRVEARWNSIRSTCWRGYSIVLRLSRLRFVVVPTGDPEREMFMQLMFAVLRCLRTVDRPVLLPVPAYREIKAQGDPQSELW